MKRFNYTIILVAVIGLAFAGCTDKFQSPTSSSDNSLPSLSKTTEVQSPAAIEKTLLSLAKTTGPGAWIFRYNETYAGFFYDPDTKLVLVIGINDIPDFLAGTGGVDALNYNNLHLPQNDHRRVLQKVRSNSVAALVYQSDTNPTLADVLDILQSGTPVASGNVNYRNNNNDLYAYSQDNKNVDSYGWRVNGTLTGGDTIYNLNFIYHAVWNGITTKQVLKIQLTPTRK